MKLKAPQGAGDPCVAGVVIEARDGVYEVEPEVGALLIESFGFAAVVDETKEIASAEAAAPAQVKAPATPVRRGRAAAKNSR